MNEEDLENLLKYRKNCEILRQKLFLYNFKFDIGNSQINEVLHMTLGILDNVIEIMIKEKKHE